MNNWYENGNHSVNFNDVCDIDVQNRVKRIRGVTAFVSGLLFMLLFMLGVAGELNGSPFNIFNFFYAIPKIFRAAASGGSMNFLRAACESVAGTYFAIALLSMILFIRQDIHMLRRLFRQDHLSEELETAALHLEGSFGKTYVLFVFNVIITSLCGRDGIKPLTIAFLILGCAIMLAGRTAALIYSDDRPEKGRLISGLILDLFPVVAAFLICFGLMDFSVIDGISIGLSSLSNSPAGADGVKSGGIGLIVRYLSVYVLVFIALIILMRTISALAANDTEYGIRKHFIVLTVISALLVVIPCVINILSVFDSEALSAMEVGEIISVFMRFCNRGSVSVLLLSVSGIVSLSAKMSVDKTETVKSPF